MKIKKMFFKKLKAIISLIFILLVIVYIIRVVVNKVQGNDRAIDFLGCNAFVVHSGSMEPTLSIGDLILVKKTENIECGDIISFYDNNSIITHRVMEILESDNEISYKTKGDYNDVVDGKLVTPKDIVGKFCFSIPKAGSLVMFLKTPAGFMIVFILLYVLSNQNEKKK